MPILLGLKTMDAQMSFFFFFFLNALKSFKLSKNAMLAVIGINVFLVHFQKYMFASTVFKANDVFGPFSSSGQCAYANVITLITPTRFNTLPS